MTERASNVLLPFYLSSNPFYDSSHTLSFQNEKYQKKANESGSHD